MGDLLRAGEEAAQGAEDTLRAGADEETHAADAVVSEAGNGGDLLSNSFIPESEQLPYTPQGHLFGQMQPSSCVAGCARMVMANVGQDLPELFIRNAANVDAVDGGYIRDLPDAFEQLGGPHATFVKHGSTADLQAATSGGMPAIVSVKTALDRHALMVDAFRETDIGTTVLVRDPLPRGQGSAYEVTLDTFLNVWTGSFVKFP